MSQGYSADDCLPKFFKVYIPDESGDDLKLPISFNPCLPQPESLPKTVTVRSIYGNVWTMKFRKCSGDLEKFVMVDGWKRIVKDEDLKGGEFLVFEFDGSRLFNFCIYGDETCKKLRGSMQTKEIEEKSHCENDILVIDDDDDDDETDAQSDGENKSRASDADYNSADDHNGGDYANDDDDGDDYVADNDPAFDDDDDVGADDDDERRYLDNPENPFFAVTLNPKRTSQLLIPAQIIGDYALSFPKSITVLDPLAEIHGKLVKTIKIQMNGMVCVRSFGCIIRRNNVKTTDKMICEIKKRGNLVHTIKIHIIRG